MTEKFAERTAGIWFPLGVYAAGGIYMLAFWAVIDRTAYHLAALGVVSLLIAAALYFVSRWAFWVGLFTFPLLFTEFVLAAIASVNLAGWYPDVWTGLFNASLIVYLVFLTLSLIMLIDKRNTLKKDRILDRLSGAPKPAEPKPVK
jgi:hypothetical protein